MRAYRHRTRIEATFADAKRRGFDLELTTIVPWARLDRLVLAIVLWWGTQLRLRVIRAGNRAWYDHAHRRDCSVISLGSAAVAELIHHNRRPTLPFSKHAGERRFAYYA